MFIAALVLLQDQIFVKTVSVHFVRPSRIAEKLQGVSDQQKQPAQMLLPKGVSMECNDAASQMIFSGENQEDLDAAASIVAMFDQAPRHLQALVTIDSPVDHYATRNTIDCVSNEGWTFESNLIHLKVAATLRLNNDMTITAYVKIDGLGGYVAATTRVSSGKAAKFRLQGTALNIDYGQSPSPLDPPSRPITVMGAFRDPLTITLKPSVMEVSTEKR